MNAYVRCKEMKGAYQVWNDMIAAKIEPNIVTFTTLIKGYSENDMISSAQSLLVDMLSGNILEGMTQPPPLPSSRTLNTFWRGCIRWGSIGSALAIFTMINEQPHLHDAIVLDETSYEYLITLLCQSFDLQTAINLTLQYLEIYSTIKSNSVLNLHWIDTENDSDLQRIINLSDVTIDTPDNIQLLLKYSITRTMNIDAILSTASIFLNLSRTFILLKKYTEIGQIFLTITENFIQETKSSSLRLAMEKRRKSEPSDTAAAGDHPPLPSSSFSGNQQRDQNQNSNSIMLFIQHRSAELSREVSLLKSYLQQSLRLKTAAATTTRGEGGGLESEIVNAEDEEMSTESLENILNGYMKTLLFYNLHELNQDNGNEQGEAEGEGKREGGHWKDQLQTGMLTQLNESFGLTNFINHFSSRKKNLKKSMITRVMKAILSSIKDNHGDKDKDKDKGSQETRSGFYIDFHSLFRHTQQSQHTVGRAGVGVKRKDPSTSSSSNQQSQSQQQQRKKKMREPSVAEEEEENDDNDQEEEEEVAELEVKMEICSGSGEWIIEQAMEYQRRRSTVTARTSASAASSLKPILWVALEIRADRVYQALTHSILRRATGQVALLGGDATVILPDLIPNNSITTIFINHPEPPERSSGGEDRSQGSHLLTGMSMSIHTTLVEQQ
jgi:pentatricopeptide repeat protein